jgi:hypothetical protein
MDGGHGGVATLPEDVAGIGEGEDEDDARSVASSTSSVLSELAGPSTSKAKKTGKKKKAAKTAKTGKKDKRKQKTTGTHRIICFASNFGLNMLRNAEVWSSDGTFSVCPEPFYQLYSIHAHVGHNTYPAAFLFLPGKKRIHYHVSLFCKIRNET